MGLLDLFRGGKTPIAIATAQHSQGMGTDGWLGPGTPLTPVGGYSGTPRAMDFPTGINTATRSRQSWGARTSYETLREMLRASDIAQACMNHKIDEIRSMEPLFTPVDGAEGDTKLAVEAARAALAFPDREHSYDEWLSLWLINMLTFDSGPLKKRRNMNGEVIGLDIIDGSTIYPYIDKHGRRPKAPAPAYYQIIQGQTYQEFTAEDIIYPRFRPQTDSPFGMAPMETVLLTINTNMRLQWHFLQMYTDGNIPGGFMEAPPELSSADQVAEFQDFWNAMFDGDQSQKHKVVFVPSGSRFQQTMPEGFDKEFPKFLELKVCAAFGVVPQDLGITDDVNRATGETQTDTQFRVNTLPWVRFVESHLNRYIQKDLGLPVEVKLNTGRDKEDRLQEAQLWKIAVETGIASMDEAREELFGLPADALRPVPRGIITPRLGFVPLQSILAISGTVDPETKAPSDDVPLDENTFNGTPGLMPDKLPGIDEFKRAPINPDEPSFPALERNHPETGTIAAKPAPAVAKSAEVTVAGAAVKAKDTGRVLMIQRYLDPEDPAAGRWEFPGGHLDAGEDAQTAAIREWEEETGLDFPDDANLAGTWANGNYAGHVFKIDTEASIPINSGNGEDNETLAWFDPEHLDGFPALREELAANLPREELAKAQAKEMGRFKAFAKKRARIGTWRDFEFTTVHKSVADHLNAQARTELAKDDHAGTDARPKAGTPSWRDTTPANAQPQHAVDLALTDYWAPRIQDSLTDLWREADLQSAITATDGVGDVALGVFRDVARRVLSGSVQPSTLEQVITNAWADAYHVGIMAAQKQMGDVVPNWSTWEPGMTDANKITALGWKEALDASGHTIKDVADTTIRRLANRIADGVNAGDPSDVIGRSLREILDDPARAEMIAQTETARMLTNAAMAQYQALGLNEWVWVTSAGACSSICAPNEGKHFPVGESLIPAHPFCRCAASPLIEGH
ncbi:phage portal protein [Arthrobacter bambusae]|uniref:phage portal protein n=1 Tax=Arthrobacter bambusae TaxID=1338426 RepID=UPI0027823AB2|nr:phage portal protein [Arthrobacter bambusae]MDQ0241171.1 HK97 family phage portal protein [Arthrobacter bambusae]